MGADLKDENKKTVPEAISKQKEKMLQFLLAWWRPDKWGKHRKIDVLHNGGVLVVGDIRHDIPNKVNNGTATSVKAKEVEGGAEDDSEDRSLAVVRKSQMAISSRRRLQIAKPSSL